MHSKDVFGPLAMGTALWRLGTEKTYLRDIRRLPVPPEYVSLDRLNFSDLR